MLFKLTLAALAAAAATAACAADATSAWALGQLKEMDASGFGAPVDGMTWEGSVTTGETGKIAITVPAEGKYAIVGSCGEDCTDIGLILDQDGKAVAQNVTGFRADLKPGSYSLLVGFDNCKSAECRYVVRVYQAK